MLGTRLQVVLEGGSEAGHRGSQTHYAVPVLLPALLVGDGLGTVGLESQLELLPLLLEGGELSSQALGGRSSSLGMS